ncbi:hypothetical protein RZM80_005723 [Pseudomonas aeruginosa]|uniref:hypothetical protein n=1 Tax=Pseudomonas aeruginosa TaxID=287 RepID=UPI00109DEF31|nr:hypothetical protein [Pseudomonas aeruginosa]EKV1241289.1 hypothetical protein [Pseudomonas aeruginosa]ELN5407416.1 hypothetical protein [Pseudomonas aeruginosa]ELP1438607.1 hypothetical protein [Pseudomonas aeruginosa]
MIKYLRGKLKARKFKKSLESYKPVVEHGDQYDSDIFSINAFFTCFVDYEHHGEFRKFYIGEHDYHDLLYFGLTTDGRVSYQGIQTKNLYKLVEFITVNNLWPEQIKVESALDEVEKAPSFRKVVEALDASDYKDPEIVLAFNTYPLTYLAIAYTAVGEVGLDKLMNTQPVFAGRLAMNKILDIVYKKRSRKYVWVKRILIAIFVFWLGGFCISYVVDAFNQSDSARDALNQTDGVKLQMSISM